jgi:hypothetical protein
VAVVLAIDDQALAVGVANRPHPFGAEHHVDRPGGGSPARERTERCCDHTVGGDSCDDHAVPEEPSDPRVGGIPIHIGWRSDLHDLPGAHDGDHIGDRECLRLIVGDEHGGCSGFAEDPPDLAAHTIALRRVEVRERLIEEDHVGLGGEGAGEGDALLFPSGQFVRHAVGQIQESHQRQHVGDSAPPIPILDPVADVGGDGHVREQCVVLEHHAHPSSLRGDVDAPADDRSPGDRDLSGIRGLETGDDAQGGRLAASGGPHEAGDPSALNLQVEAVERGRRAEMPADPGADDRVLGAARRRVVPEGHGTASFGRTTRKYMGTADIASSRRAEAAALP